MVVKLGLLHEGKMKLMVSKKGVPRRIFGPERDKIREVWRKMDIEELCYWK
jgi:hypothetical protein